MFLKFFAPAEIHAFPNTWEKWISIIREKYGKTQAFQIYGFLPYFMCDINTYNSQNMRKVNLHSEEKIWEDTNISKLSVSEIFRSMRKSMQFQHMGKVNFHNTEKVREKNKHSKVMGFSTILSEVEIHTITKIWKKWIPIAREKNLHSTGKVRENTEISHSLCYLSDLEFMRNHGIPNVCKCTNSHKMEIFCGRPYHSQAVGFWGS